MAHPTLAELITKTNEHAAKFAAVDSARQAERSAALGARALDPLLAVSSCVNLKIMVTDQIETVARAIELAIQSKDYGDEVKARLTAHRAAIQAVAEDFPAFS